MSNKTNDDEEYFDFQVNGEDLYEDQFEDDGEYFESEEEEMEYALRTEIVGLCEQLHQKNLLAAGDGNVSLRINDDYILITPSGRPKAFLIEDDIAIITISGEVIFGKPSSEMSMHLAIYRQCPEARAVIHAHPPHAIAWSVAFPEAQALPENCLSEVILATGGIPIAPYARPGSEDMGEVLKPYISNYKNLILSRHGAVSWGESLQEAYMGMERIEHSAYILFLAQQLGGLTSLPEDEVQYLLNYRREKIGNRSL